MKIKKEFQKKAHYRFLLLLIVGFLMGQNVLAQEITASGVVKDSRGEALIGAIVTAEGTELGTVTNFDGEFTLTVPQGSMLNFAYLGLESQRRQAAAGMNITLQTDAVALAAVEVVGIGYGTARRSDLTGAITSINADGMRQGVITSSEQLLQSKVAGLSVVQSSGNPVAGASLRLRGGSSLSGNNDPLVVVDGVPNVPMSAVSPSDIVSVDVLKDASASAIYGSRGANGVILITTRRQSADRDVTITSADYSGYLGIARAAKQLDLLTADNWETGRPGAPNFGGNTNWQDEIQQTALTHSHSVNFASSSNRGGFKGNLSYLNAEGVIKTTQMERLGANVSGYTRVWDDRLTLDAGINVSQENYSDIDYGRVFRSAYGLNPTLPVRWSADNEWGKKGEYAQDTENADPRYANPIEYFNNRTEDRTRNRFLTHAKADLRIIEGLNATVNISRNHVVNNDRRYVNRGAFELLGRAEHTGGDQGNATRDSHDWSEQTIEGFLTYNKEFNRKHRLNLMAGSSYAVAIAEGMGAGVRGFDFDDFLYNNLEAGIFREYIYSYKTNEQLASFFGRVNYSYDSKYMRTATLRQDGASKFGANNKWAVFPSASVAWRVTQEDFMGGTKSWLQDLKLRVSYGITGNQAAIQPYTSMKLWATSKAGGGHYRQVIDVLDDDGNKIGERVTIMNFQNQNPDLKWESTGQWNVGLDFDMFRRISATLEFYHKNTKDLLYFYNLGSDGGSFYPYQLLNIGSMTNTGVEFSLRANILKGTDYSLDANLNLAHNANKVTKISDPRFPGTQFDAGFLFGMAGGGATGYATQQIKEGYSIGSFFGAVNYGKNENGDLVYRKTVDGVVMTTTDAGQADKLYLGSAMPKLTLGFNLSFNYKKWDLGVNTYGMFGQKIYNATRQDLYSRFDRETLNVMNDWATRNQDVKGVSDYWLEDGSFFRLQNLTLGYTFDLRKIKMQSLRLYASVDNLFVITGYKGVDPEVGQTMNVTEELDRNKEFPGIDWYNNYPKPRNFIVGVNLNF